ncbi:hypothetical protein JCM3770_007008 [Rhodotorula araucariae]
MSRSRPAPLTAVEWTRTINFAVLSLVISCTVPVIHHIQHVPVDAHARSSGDYCTTFAAVWLTKVNFDTIYSSHLLAALPSLLAAL